MNPLYVTFHSVSSALLMEAQMQPICGCRVVPVPRALSSSCGYAAEVEMEEALLVAMLQEDDAIEWEGVYRQKEDGSFTQIIAYTQ